MNQDGWICLHRQIFDDDLNDQPTTTRWVFVFLLCAASHKPHRGLKAGQVRTSTRFISDDANLEIKGVTRALRWLEQDGKITRKMSAGGRGGTGRTVITINGWRKYQSFLRGSVVDSPTVEPTVEPTHYNKGTIEQGKDTAQKAQQPRMKLKDAEKRAWIELWARAMVQRWHKLSPLTESQKTAQNLGRMVDALRLLVTNDKHTQADVERVIDHYATNSFASTPVVLRNGLKNDATTTQMEYQLQMLNAKPHQEGAAEQRDQYLADIIKS